jgi:hypothetical protein
MKRMELIAGVVMSIAAVSTANAGVPVGAPEIDATSGVAAMSLVIGVLAWVSERKRRKQSD